MRVLLCILLFASRSFAGCGEPVPDGLACTTQQIGSATQKNCLLTDDKYRPACSSSPQPFAISYQNGQDKLIPSFKLPGSTPYPISCVTPDLGYLPGNIQLDMCGGHYGAFDDCGGTVDWGSWFFGDSHQERAIAVLDTMYRDNLNIMDFNAGVHCFGSSIGSYRCSALAMDLKDEFHRSRFTLISVFSGATDLDSPRNTYGPEVEDFDFSRVDFSVQAAAGKLDNQFWVYVVDDADTSVAVDTAKKAAECNQYRIKCKIFKHPFGHGGPNWSMHDPRLRGLYNGPDEQHRLDLPVIVFTNSSADDLSGDWGIYGYGNTYNAAGIVDTSSLLKVPLGYRPITDPLTGINMPPSATSDVTIRPRHFEIISGNQYRYQFGDIIGYSTAEKSGEITIPSVSLSNDLSYTMLEINDV